MPSFTPGWDHVPAPLAEFHAEYVLGSLTTLSPDGTPHTVPVGVTLDPERGCAWVITRDSSRKVRNVESAGGPAPVTVCQVAGAKWATVEGTATVRRDDDSVQRAVELYAERYGRRPTPDARRVALRIEVGRILHGPALQA